MINILNTIGFGIVGFFGMIFFILFITPKPRTNAMISGILALGLLFGFGVALIML